MAIKMEQLSGKNPNPVLSVGNDGTVLYSNEAGELLLREWGIGIGEKLTLRIEDLVQRAISRNISEKFEVKVGKRVYLLTFHPLPEDECVNIYGLDISHQKDLERELQENKEDLAIVQRMSHIGNWKWNIVTNELSWSDEVYRIFGFKPQEFSVTFDEYFKYVHPEDQDYLNNAIKKAFEGKPYSVDNRIITANGEERIVHTDAEIIFNEDNIPVYARGIVQDITERKRGEEALCESEERYRAFFNNSAVGALEIDPSGRIIKVNDRYCQITGYTREELIGMNVAELSHPDDRDYDRKLLGDYLSGGTPTFDVEKRYVHKDGRVIWIQITAAMICDTEGRPLRSSGVVQDITERKEAEAKLKDTLDNLDNLVRKRTEELEKAYNSLKESEGRLAEAQEMAHIGSWERIIATNEFNWSDEMYRIVGLKPQEFKMNYSLFLNYVYPDDRDHIDNAVKEALNGEPIDINFRIIRADGEERIAHSKGDIVFDEKNNPVRIRGTTQDITERKKAEEWTAYLASYPELNPNPIFEVNSDGMMVYANPAAKQIFPDLATWGIDHPILWGFREIVDWFKGYKLFLVRDIKFNDSFYEQSIYFVPDRKIVRFYNLNITERKWAEESLKESEERLRLAQQAARIGTFEWNIQTGVNVWTPELEAMYGLQPGEFGKTQLAWEQLVHPDDRTYATYAVEQAIRTGEPTECEFRVIWPDGSVHWISGRWQVFKDAMGQPLRLTGVNIDITERKRTEDMLRLSEEKFSKAFATNPAAISMTHLEDELVMEVNDVWLKTFGYSREEVIGTSISLQLWPTPEDRARIVQELREKGSLYGREQTFLRRSGEPFTALASAVILTVEGKEVLLSTWLDITERKQAEEKLRKSEAKLRAVFSALTEGIVFLNIQGDVEEVNNAVQYTIGQTLQDLTDPELDPRFRIIRPDGTLFPVDEQPVSLALRTGKAVRDVEMGVTLSDGRLRWILVNAQPVYDDQDNLIGAVASFFDITERKQAEETLAKIEIARKQEIHHRIKNNLQVISSLLDLQAEQFKDKECIKDSEVLEAFRESQDRVMSMALIHEELHKGREIDTLNFSSYLEELVDNLFLTYRLENKNVSLNMDLEEEILFDMDIAIPLGMIVNELVSNSLKYAFIGKDKGEIQIKMQREGIKNEDCSTIFALTISDNGVGIPENLDIEDFDSLGFQLVTTLVDQLDGELELKRDNGTEFTIRFMVTENNDSVSVPTTQQSV
jgi:PAS domain S-box-containing protein